MKTQPIKTVVIEEHNEAFYVWQQAVQHGFIQPNGNCLLHIDEHSDMGVQCFNQSLDDLNGNMDAIEQITNDEVGIAGFIMPSVYLGLFSDVYWIKQKHRAKSRKQFDLFIGSFQNDGKTMISGEWDSLKKSREGIRRFSYNKVGIEEVGSQHRQVVLDIDLDYFSCSGDPNMIDEVTLEITREEYERFHTNRYHRLKYLGVGKIEACQVDNQYYYILNRFDHEFPQELRKTEEEIDGLIHKVVGHLAQQKIVPQFITICRSRHSGYTPHDQWQAIEDRLLQALGNLYTLDVEFKHCQPAVAAV